MKKLFCALILLMLFFLVPSQTRADIGISIQIPLPPLFVLEAPPAVIPIPDTNNVYVVPDIDVDVFFWNGWWWMPWRGHWYRSSYYDRGWAYYTGIPRFYYDVDPDWRRYYRDRQWYGHRWYYERIPHHQLQQNWRSWHNSRHWERRGSWGVQNYRPRPPQERRDLRYQRQKQYHQSPEVQQHQPRPQYQQPGQRPHSQQPRPQLQRPSQPKPQSPGGGHGKPPLRGFGHDNPPNSRGR